MLLNAPSRDKLNKGARHRVPLHAKLALGEGIEAGALNPNVETDPIWHCARGNKVPLEPWKQVTERALAAAEQRVQVPGLGRSSPVSRLRLKGIALQYSHVLEVSAERARDRQPAPASADDDGLPADRSGHHGGLRTRGPPHWRC